MPVTFLIKLRLIIKRKIKKDIIIPKNIINENSENSVNTE